MPSSITARRFREPFPSISCVQGSLTVMVVSGTITHPMPLKHATETVLVFILGLATVLAGVVLGILPSVQLSIIPWLVLFGLTLLYPLVLYPLLRNRRADYPFRLLHFVPALMVLAWLALDVLSSYTIGAQSALRAYTWGWTFLAVVIAFFLFVWFCLSVIRQRVTRIGLLGLILVPFAILAFASEERQWPDRLANAVWPRVGIGTQIAVVPTQSGSLAWTSSASSRSSSSSSASAISTSASSVSLNTSSLGASTSSVGASSVQVMIVVSSSSTSSARSETFVAAAPKSSAAAVKSSSSDASKKSWYDSIFGSGEESSASVSSSSSSQSSAVIVATKPPPHLSSSGPGEVAGLGLMFAAAYCGVLHRRAIKRKA